MIRIKNGSNSCARTSKESAVKEANMHKKRSESTTRGRWGLAVVVAAFVVFFLLDGLVNAFGVLATELLVELQFPRQLNGWITSVRVIMTMGMSPVASLCSRRFGNRPTAIAGVLICSIGYGASSFVTEPWTLLITFGLAVGFGGSLMYLPTLMTISIYFDKRISAATGIALCGPAVGTMALSPLVGHLIETYTWRGCLQILSALMLHGVAMATIFRPLPDPTDGTAYRAAPAKVDSTDPVDPLQVDNHEDPPSPLLRLLKLLKRHPRLVPFLLANILISVGFNSPFLFSPDWAQQFAGASPQSASLLVSILGAASFLGRAVFGLLADRTEGARRLMLYGVAVGAAGAAQALAFASVSYAYMAVWCAAVSFFICPLIIMMSAVLVDLVGQDNLNESLGLTLLCQGVGGTIGPPLAGFLFDSTRSFDLSFGVCGSIVAVGGLIACLQGAIGIDNLSTA